MSTCWGDDWDGGDDDEPTNGDCLDLFPVLEGSLAFPKPLAAAAVGEAAATVGLETRFAWEGKMQNATPQDRLEEAISNERIIKKT